MKIPLLVLLGALAGAGAACAADSSASIRSISAEGVATQEYAPDRADLSVEIKVVSDALHTSRDAVDVAHEALLRAMKKAGIPEKDVGLESRTLRRETSWENGRPVFRGYACTASIVVIVRKLDTLSVVTEAMARIDELALGGMTFRSAKEGEARREALLRAAEAAKQKAEALAKNAGVKITALLELREVPSPTYHGSATSNFSGSVDSEYGVAPNTVRVEVYARYAIE